MARNTGGELGVVAILELEIGRVIEVGDRKVVGVEQVIERKANPPPTVS